MQHSIRRHLVKYKYKFLFFLIVWELLPFDGEIKMYIIQIASVVVNGHAH